VKLVFKVDDPVKLSFAQAVLKEAGIESVVLDEHVSSLYGGDIPFSQRRVMVDDEDEHAAREALRIAFDEAERSEAD
jgi:hypothetical protein